MDAVLQNFLGLYFGPPVAAWLKEKARDFWGKPYTRPYNMVTTAVSELFDIKKRVDKNCMIRILVFSTTPVIDLFPLALSCFLCGRIWMIQPS